MTDPGSSIHKKLVIGAAGCVTMLVVVMVIGMISVRHMGFETPAPPRYATPATAIAAVDSLSRVDFSRWLEPAGAPAQLRCRDPKRSERVSPVSAIDSLAPPIGFGDTFPPGSTARRIWEGLGGTVDLEPATGAATPADSLPAGRELLAALRVRVTIHDRIGACVLLDAVVEKTRGLESDPRLDRSVAGARLARDAASMVSRDTALRSLTGLTEARAATLLATLEIRKQLALGVMAMIDAAATSPASADSLAAWAQNEDVPLQVRHAYVEAIGYGWVLDPPEMTFGPSSARRVALERLLQAAIPSDLSETARAARQVMQSNFAQRFQFAVTYRTRRGLPP
ncbi:MAG TPA: hypothetical protein VKB63_15310 [Gemmatimonadales bacterium]|nr:hypothetical protein [Gemmatimonadales bacterium]